MHAQYNGNTYRVHFSDADAQVFTQYTDAPEGVVVGGGEFVFDTGTGDLVKRRGAAEGRDELEWLAFSQDAQDFGREELARQGVEVNAYDFAASMPELSKNPRGKPDPRVGRRIELVHSTDPAILVPPGGTGTVTMVDDAGNLYIHWDNGQRIGLIPGVDDFQFVTNPNPDRISRTRGVKTLKGPYSAGKGYQPWIKHRGTLGEGFLTTMTKAQRERALDDCVADFGYRSCLGKILALERAKRGPRGRGEGVGVKYASKLKTSREYLVRTYGGPGSFGPRKKKKKRPAARKAADNPKGSPGGGNPTAAQHGRNAAKYLEAGEKAIRSAQRHYARVEKKAGDPEEERDKGCDRAKEAWRYALLVQHELEHGTVSDEQRRMIWGGSVALRNAAGALFDRLRCSLGYERPGNPELTPEEWEQYRQEMQIKLYAEELKRWEKRGRQGPPPQPPFPINADPSPMALSPGEFH